MLRLYSSAKSAVGRMNWLFLAMVAILAAASLASCFGFDQWVLSALLRSSVDWDANLWVGAFTRLGKGWLQVWLLLVWLRACHRRRDVLVGLVALALVGVSVNAVKLAVMRPRPSAVVRIQSVYHLTQDMSFPSGDAASAVAVTTAILPALSGAMPYVFGAGCAAIAGLRVATLAHYPSDVLAGAAIGLLAGWLAGRLVDKWNRSDRQLPLERWLVLAGILGIPVVVALFRGLDEIWLVSRTYGLIVLALLAASQTSRLVKAAPDKLLAFLTKGRSVALLLIFCAAIAGNILYGEKPRELLPFDEQPVSLIAVVGLLLVLAGSGVRLWVHSRAATPAESRLTVQRILALGTSAIVCGLLLQLRNPMNWLVVMPVFALFYGVPLLGWRGRPMLAFAASSPPRRGNPCPNGLLENSPTSPRRAHGWSWRPSIFTRELCTTLALLLLPFAIELLVEDFVFEGLLHF